MQSNLAEKHIEEAQEVWTKSVGIETNDVVKKKLEGAAAPSTK